MKVYYPLTVSILSLSLSLTACGPASTPALQTPTNQFQTETQAQTESIGIHFETPQADFSTQAVGEQPAYVQVKMELEERLTLNQVTDSNRGEALKIVDGVTWAYQGGNVVQEKSEYAFYEFPNSIDVSKQPRFKGIPINPGKLRVITAYGYDKDFKRLPGYVSKNYYISNFASSGTRLKQDINLSRRYLIPSTLVEKLLPLSGGDIDKVKALITSKGFQEQFQKAVDEATGYNPNAPAGQKFTQDPSTFDVDKVLALLKIDRVPTAQELKDQAQNQPGFATIQLNTAGGSPFQTGLNISIDDIKSTVVNINANSASPQNPFFNVTPGDWTLTIKNASGTELGSTSVKVDSQGQVTLGQNSFTLQQQPIVSTLNQSIASTAGGSTLIITGTDFTGTTAVKFGSSDATQFTVDSDTQITAIVPAHAVGQIDVTVTSPGGQSATHAQSKLSYETPSSVSVTQLSPAKGLAVGGNLVTITGTDFTGATAVQFGSTNATQFTVDSNTQITATVPAHINTGTVSVTVTAPNGSNLSTANSQYEYGLWDLAFSDNNNRYFDLATGQGQTIAVGSDGKILSTSDGSQWTSRTPAVDASLRVVEYLNGQFVAAGIPTATVTGLPGNGKDVCFSSDGISWSTYNTVNNGNSTTVMADPSAIRPQLTSQQGPYKYTMGMAFGLGQYLAVSQSVGAYASTNDQLNWQGKTYFNPLSNGQISNSVIGADNDVAFGKGLFVALNDLGILTSRNGNNWNYRAVSVEHMAFPVNSGGLAPSLNPNAWLRNIAYAQNIFVVVGTLGEIFTSTDTLTWTHRNSGTTEELYDVQYFNDRFVAVGSNGVVIQSPDGITWSSLASTGANMANFSVSHTGDKLVVLGQIPTDPQNFGTRIFTIPFKTPVAAAVTETPIPPFVPVCGQNEPPPYLGDDYADYIAACGNGGEGEEEGY